MAINQDIINPSTTWEDKSKGYIEDGLKELLRQMLAALEDPEIAANSVGRDQLTQALRDAIDSIANKVPNNRTVNGKALSSNITIGAGDINVDNQTLAALLSAMGTDIDNLENGLSNKANDNEVVKSVTINGQTPQLNNGNVSFDVSGAQGPAGADGADGTDGKSAYQSYLDTTSDNPKKTEAEWVSSLKGEDGADGATGATGPQGPAGPAGPKGDSGVSSADGVVVVDDFSGTPSDIAAGQVAVLSADAGKELNIDVNGFDFVGEWKTGVWNNTSGLAVGGTYNPSGPTTNQTNYRYCKAEVPAGMQYHIITKCNQYHHALVITKTDGEIVYLNELNSTIVDYTTSFEFDVIVYVNNHKDFTDNSVTCHIDGLEQRVEETESKTSQVGELSREVGILGNAVNGYHVIGEWAIGCWTNPSNIAVGGTYTGVVSDEAAGDGTKYDHCEKLELTEGQTLVVKARCDQYHQTLIITKLDGEVVYVSGSSEVDQSFDIEYDGYAYVNKTRAYTGQKAEIHVYSPKEYTDEKFEAVSDFVDQQKLVGELFLSGYAFFNESKGTIFNPRGYALNGARIYIYQVVAGQKFSKIVASSFTGNYADYVFTDNAGRILKTSGADTYNTGIRTMNNVTAPEGATRLYVSENTANGEGSSGVYASVIDNDAMVATRNLEATKMKISAEERVRYYHLGAQKMDTYNLVREKVGIITIGQSNIDGRIAAADFPATANINGTDISLAKSIPTCKYMRGTADSATYDEATRSFAAYNNTGAWSFDQVVYNAIANALGSETDFYVCKQSRGGTSIGYAQYTSFCADIDDFKFYNGRDWSQLYHLKCLVKRALELQPDLKFKAIIMHQGEQDENIVKTSGTYYINLCRLIQWIRGLVGSPKLPFIFGSIPTNSSSFNQIIYDDMVRVATDLNDVYLVTMGEATDWVDDQWHSGTTGLHFGANTAVNLADDMYQLMVSRKMLAPYV